MFRRQMILSLLLFALITGATATLIVRVNDRDHERYNRLVKQGERGVNEAIESQSTQVREGVVKEMWLADRPERLQFRLTSESSELVVGETGEQQRAIEYMKGVTGYMQEELYYLLPDGRRAHRVESGLYRLSDDLGHRLQLPGDDWIPMQEVRYIQAKEASFDYSTHRFIAHQVTMIRFESQGHDLAEQFEKIDPVMSGTARTIEFTLNGDQLDLEAYRLQARIFSKEKLL